MQNLKQTFIFYLTLCALIAGVFGYEGEFNTANLPKADELFEAIQNPKILSSKYGVASFYGRNDGFHGRQTASGQVFNAMNFTAAHRTLSFGTKVLVTNPSNGKKILVTINDRGPFHPKREIDLSYGAAKEIGIVSNGLAKVLISVIG